jgi:hypothetical protein
MVETMATSLWLARAPHCKPHDLRWLPPWYLRVLNRFGPCGPLFQPKADHKPYLHENKTKTTKTLFPVRYT